MSTGGNTKQVLYAKVYYRLVVQTGAQSLANRDIVKSVLVDHQWIMTICPR